MASSAWKNRDVLGVYIMYFKNFMPLFSILK